MLLVSNGDINFRPHSVSPYNSRARADVVTSSSSSWNFLSSVVRWLGETETIFGRISSYKEATACVSFEMLEGAEDASSRRSAIVWLTS